MNSDGILDLPRVVLGPRYADRNYGLIGETPGCPLNASERATAHVLLNAARFLGSNPPPCAVCLPLGRGASNWAVGWIRAQGTDRIFADLVVATPAELADIGWATHKLLAVLWEEPVPQGEGLVLDARRFQIAGMRSAPTISREALTQVSNAVSESHSHTIAVADEINPAYVLAEVWETLDPSERATVSFATSQKLQQCGQTEGLAPFDMIVAPQSEIPPSAMARAQRFDAGGLQFDVRQVQPFDVIARESELAAYHCRAKRPPPAAAAVDVSEKIFAVLIGIHHAQVAAAYGDKGDVIPQKWGEYLTFMAKIAAGFKQGRAEDTGSTIAWDAYQTGLLRAFAEEMKESRQFAARSIKFYVENIERLLVDPRPEMIARLTAARNAYWYLDPSIQRRVLPIILGNSYMAQEMARYLGVPENGDDIFPAVKAVSEAMIDVPSEGLDALCGRFIKIAAAFEDRKLWALTELSGALQAQRKFSLLAELLEASGYDRELAESLIDAGSNSIATGKSSGTPLAHFERLNFRFKLHRTFRGELS